MMPLVRAETFSLAAQGLSFLRVSRKFNRNQCVTHGKVPARVVVGRPGGMSGRKGGVWSDREGLAAGAATRPRERDSGAERDGVTAGDRSEREAARETLLFGSVPSRMSARMHELHADMERAVTCTTVCTGILVASERLGILC